MDKEEAKKIRTGWDRLTKSTQQRLSAMGIRGLEKTPGKLINAKGYIPGALGGFGIVWGKLKATGDLAERAMGFRPREGAVGVLLSRRRYVDANGKIRTGIFAISLMPWRGVATDDRKRGYERMRVLGKMASKHKNYIVNPIWDPIVTNRNRPPWDGYRYFMSVNNKNIGNALRWEKLRISLGPVNPPKFVCANRYYREKMEIQIFVPRTIKRKPITEHQIGIGIFDKVTGDFFHIPPEELSAEIEKRLNTKGLKASDLERAPVADLIEPIRFTWELKHIRKYADKRVGSGKQYTRFYLFNYYKMMGERLRPRSPFRQAESGNRLKDIPLTTEKQIGCGERGRSSFRYTEKGYGEKQTDNKTPGKPQYSVSICSRVEAYQARQAEGEASGGRAVRDFVAKGNRGIPVIVSVVEQLTLGLKYENYRIPKYELENRRAFPR